MADYFTHFSCLLDVGTSDNAARAIELYEGQAVEDEAGNLDIFTGFSVSVQDRAGSAILWIHDDESGDVEAVIRFVLHLAEALDLSGLWGFDYANTCSRPRLDGFGGGAHVIDLGARKSLGWISTHEWLTAALNGEDLYA